MSKIKLYFILKSRFESVLKLGVWLTSSNQGFNLLSKRMSNPNTSKQSSNYSLFGLLDLYECAIIGYTDAIVFTIIPLIFFIKLSISWPYSSRNYNTEDKLRLCPYSLF